MKLSVSLKKNLELNIYQNSTLSRSQFSLLGISHEELRQRWIFASN